MRIVTPIVMASDSICVESEEVPILPLRESAKRAAAKSTVRAGKRQVTHFLPVSDYMASVHPGHDIAAGSWKVQEVTSPNTKDDELDRTTKCEEAEEDYGESNSEAMIFRLDVAKPATLKAAAVSSSKPGSSKTGAPAFDFACLCSALNGLDVLDVQPQGDCQHICKRIPAGVWV